MKDIILLVATSWHPTSCKIVGDMYIILKSPLLLDLSRWMNRLFHRLEAGHRQQIRDRAARQRKEMTVKSVQKSTQKRQVNFVWNVVFQNLTWMQWSLTYFTLQPQKWKATNMSFWVLLPIKCRWNFWCPFIFKWITPFHSTCGPWTARTGGRDLSSSAAYPRDFGREVARLHVDELVAWSFGKWPVYGLL